MNKNISICRVTTPFAGALATVLFVATAAVSAQPPTTQPEETSAKTAPAVTAPDAAAKDTDAVLSAVPTAANPDSTQPPESRATEQTAESEEEAFDMPPLQVGDATLNLFAWQRSGEIASPTSRPIAGSVASRSYDRYLKSFEYPIPERLGSTVKSSASGSVTAGGVR